MQEVFKRAATKLLSRFGVQVTYHLRSGGPIKNITALVRRPPRLSTFEDTRLYSPTQVIEVRCEDIPTPGIGDRIEYDETVYRVQSEPIADQHRLIWTLDVVCN